MVDHTGLLFVVVSADVLIEHCLVVRGLLGVSVDFSLFFIALLCCLIISFLSSFDVTPVFFVSFLSASKIYANWQSWKPWTALAKLSNFMWPGPFRWRAEIRSSAVAFDFCFFAIFMKSSAAFS